MGPTGDVHRVLQIHPTRRCNLRCLHCYSSSAPEERDQIGIDVIRGALTDAGAEGYTVAGFSGGEPLLYKGLRAALAHARACGMITTVTSNGMLLDERRLEALQGVVNLLAISLDGAPESHNRMRGSGRAFDAMAARLEGVRKSSIPFGFIFTLTQHNLQELGWVASFALEQGARLLQIHPLEMIGRAQEELPGSSPDGTRSAYAHLAAERIREVAGDKLYVQLDLAYREALRAHPDHVFGGEPASDEPARLLADLVSPLVIEPDGMVVPIQHGFGRAYALGNLAEASLRELAARWRRGRYPAFRRLCREVWQELTEPTAPPLTNWYEVIGRRSLQQVGPPASRRSAASAVPSEAGA